MPGQRWSDVARLYHAAASRDPAERGAFLADACAGDEALRDEVESLLAQESGAVGFLSSPGLAGRLLESGPSFVGRQLGPYAIQELLGAGGMGEVYRARDGKLGRDVAIKILPSAFTGDGTRLARFEREARILASLNHPHVGAIYGLAEADGVLALVLELVEGATLADRLAQGPVPITEALGIARQIAEGLEAAHEKGIVHRDLKPANVKITAEGFVKVLDFGLARTDAVSAQAELADSPAMRLVKTTEGMLLGTAPYMSPEQARGKHADKRTDIWAFGCVLYEMLTGRAPFAGATLTDTLAAIIERDPDWRALPERTPSSIRRVLQRCLQKDPTRRFHDMADARLDLDDAAWASAPSVGEAPADGRRSSMRERTAWVLVALATLTATSLALLHFYSPASTLAVWKFAVPAPETGDFRSGGRLLAVSPDGETIAFLASVPGGKRMLWARSRTALVASVLPGTDGAEGPFWRPDSQSIGFFANGKLRSVSTSGGVSRTICDTPGGTSQGSWNQAGDILFVAESRGVGGLLRVSERGGALTSETTPDRAQGETGHLSPYFLPDGQHYLYVVTADDGGGIYIGALGAKHGRRLLDFPKAYGVSSVAYASGFVLFVRDGTLMAQPFDARRREKTGEEVRVAEDVSNNGAGGSGAFSVSANGVLAYWAGSQAATARLSWFTRAGVETATPAPVANYERLALNPEGSLAAVEQISASGSAAIWLLDLTRGTKTRFTSDVFSVMPIWSPDGASVIFSSTRDGSLAPYRQPVSPREDAHRLFALNAPTAATDWSDDGRILYQTGSAPKDDIGVFALSEGTPRPPFLHTSVGVSDGHLSPDGRWMAYVSSGDVFVTSYPDLVGDWRVSTNGGAQPRWERHGTELYFLAPGGKVMAAKVKTTPTFYSGVPVSLFGTAARTYAVTKDGRFLLAIPSGEKIASPPITVVLSWVAGLNNK